MTGGGEDDGSPRNSIPDDLIETIQGIKKIAVNYSDDEILGMLKECNMDSEETTQKLLYFDTFQLVKRKVRVPKEVVEYSDNQYYPSDNYNVGRRLNSNQERRPLKSSAPFSRKGSSKSTDVARSNNRSTPPQPAKVNGVKDDKDVKSRKGSSANPPARGSRVGGTYKQKQSKQLVNGVDSSSASGLSPASDPVLVQSGNVKNSPPVGTIKRETAKNQKGSVDSTSSNTQSQVNGSLKEVSEDLRSKSSTSELDLEPKKSVIFPAHFHVPETFKNSLSFGSFESNNEGPSDERGHEASPIPQSGHDEPSAPLNLTSSEENILSGVADLRYEQSEQEILQSVGRSNGSLLDYGSSTVVHHQGLETQGGSSDTIPSPSQQTISTTPSDLTQPKLGSSQSGVSASPQPHMVPMVRPTYSANYMQYNPAYLQYYLPPHPQNVTHQLQSHNGYSHQPLASDVYVSPTTVGPKMQAGYKNYFSDDMSISELKEKNMHSNIAPPLSLNSFMGMYQNMPQSIHQSHPPPLMGPYAHQPNMLSLAPQQQQYGQQNSWAKKFQN